MLSGACETIGQLRVVSSACTRSSSSLALLYKPPVSLATQHQVQDTARACPREAFVAKGNNVDRELIVLRVELCGEIARRSAACLLAIRQHNDDARFGTKVERLCCLLDA